MLAPPADVRLDRSVALHRNAVAQIYRGTEGYSWPNLLHMQRLKVVGNYIKQRPIDVVVYVDRFDLFRTDGNDQQVSEMQTQLIGCPK